MNQTLQKTVAPQITADDAIQAFQEFDELCQKLLDSETDINIIKGKQYKNKRAWRKLAMVFNISSEILFREFYTTEAGIRVVTYRVRTTAPNGRTAEAEGVVTSNEKWSKGKTLSAMAGFAQTRASNRAIAYLIAPNELPAEEMTELDEEDHGQSKKPAFTQFIRTVSSSSQMTVEEAKRDFRKKYGHDIQRARAEEIDEYLDAITNDEVSRLLDKGAI